MKRLLFVTVSLLLTGVTVQALGQQGVPAKDQKAMDDFLKKYEDAYNRQDPAGVAVLYTDDAVRVTPGGIIYGREGIRKEHEGFLANAHDLTIKSEFTQALGDLILNGGEWSAKVGSQSEHGYYSGILVYEGGGLKIRYNSVNLTPSSPAQ
jgi:ketosteroid isomerase-like protein